MGNNARTAFWSLILSRFFVFFLLNKHDLFILAVIWCELRQTNDSMMSTNDTLTVNCAWDMWDIWDMSVRRSQGQPHHILFYRHFLHFLHCNECALCWSNICSVLAKIVSQFSIYWNLTFSHLTWFICFKLPI